MDFKSYGDALVALPPVDIAMLMLWAMAFVVEPKFAFRMTMAVAVGILLTALLISLGVLLTA